MRLNSNSQLDGIINIKNLYAYDKAGNLVNSNFFTDDSTVRIDNVKPMFDELNPIDSIYINNNLISYRISETVESGSVNWERVGGAEDLNSPYLVSLDASELQGNPDSYSWSEDLNVHMSLLSEDDWIDIFIKSGLKRCNSWKANSSKTFPGTLVISGDLY